MPEVAIYGSGGFAREVAWLAESCRKDDERYRVLCFIDDDAERHGTMLNGIPVLLVDEGVAL